MMAEAGSPVNEKTPALDALMRSGVPLTRRAQRPK
jgi:hypothetical protein